MNSMNFKDCAKLLKALADRVRLEIIECLFMGECSVTDIAEKIGKNHSQVSHHLGVLRNCGVVIDNKDGKFVIYRLHPDLYKQIQDGSYNNVLDFDCCKIGFAKDNTRTNDL